MFIRELIVLYVVLNNNDFLYYTTYNKPITILFITLVLLYLCPLCIEFKYYCIDQKT